MTGPLGTKCYRIYLLHPSAVFHSVGFILQYVFPEAGNITSRSLDSYPHSLPNPIERGLLFPSSTKKRKPQDLLAQIQLGHVFMSEPITVAGGGNACSSLEQELVRSALLKTNGSRMRKYHPQRKTRVLLPEDRRIVPGPAKPTDIQHTLPNQHHL